METETKFTPGPWIAREDTNAMLGEDWMIGTPNGKPDEVAVCSKRDAHLIAAAPELYKELRAAELLFCCYCNDATAANWLDRVRALVAAARGTKE